MTAALKPDDRQMTIVGARTIGRTPRRRDEV
jgi:hypothetical protein